jgi:hypothetical protein
MKDYYEAVKRIMERYPETRDDDMKLYAIIVHQKTGMSSKVGFYEAMYNHSRYALPSYESVTRARRKVQENEPSLCGKRRHQRNHMKEEYRNFYSPI